MHMAVKLKTARESIENKKARQGTCLWAVDGEPPWGGPVRALFLLHASVALNMSSSPLIETEGDMKPSMSNRNITQVLQRTGFSVHLTLDLF